eukprot:4559793-Ditylum_brightwellii.AAC.1
MDVGTAIGIIDDEDEDNDENAEDDCITQCVVLAQRKIFFALYMAFKDTLKSLTSCIVPLFLLLMMLLLHPRRS